MLNILILFERKASLKLITSHYSFNLPQKLVFNPLSITAKCVSELKMY